MYFGECLNVFCGVCECIFGVTECIFGVSECIL